MFETRQITAAPGGCSRAVALLARVYGLPPETLDTLRAMKLEWTEVPGAEWPHARYRAVGDRYEYEIIRDAAAEHITFPEGAEGEWWAGVVRALDGHDWPAGALVRFTANRTVEHAKRDAQHWEG